MAGGGIDGREEEEVGAVALRGPNLRMIVDRRAAQPSARAAPVAAVRTPSLRLCGRPREEEGECGPKGQAAAGGREEHEGP